MKKAVKVFVLLIILMTASLLFTGCAGKKTSSNSSSEQTELSQTSVNESSNSQNENTDITRPQNNGFDDPDMPNETEDSRGIISEFKDNVLNINEMSAGQSDKPENQEPPKSDGSDSESKQPDQGQSPESSGTQTPPQGESKSYTLSDNVTIKLVTFDNQNTNVAAGQTSDLISGKMVTIWLDENEKAYYIQVTDITKKDDAK